MKRRNSRTRATEWSSRRPIHRRAERLLLASRDVPLRTLDALHLATALATDAATLVTYDPRLRAAAVAQGLFVAPERTLQGSASCGNRPTQPANLRHELFAPGYGWQAHRAS